MKERTKVDANQKRNPKSKKMNTNRWIIITGLAMLFLMPNVAQAGEKEKKAIEDLINRCFVEAANNRIDIEVLKKGFQERFSWKWVHHGRLYETDLAQWIKNLERENQVRPEWHNRTSAEIEVMGIEGDAAVARVEIFNDRIHDQTIFMSLYKLSDGWQITSMISQRHQVPPESEYNRRLEWENSINKKLQPPEQVMDAIGIKPGMVIGEIGAGHGRYTVHLARRVGKKGKIYANDIDKRALSALRERCRRENIGNVETILGKEEDPLFPDQSLDMAFMVWVFHGLDKPGPLMRNLKPCLKTGSPLIIIDPVDSEIDMEREFAGEKVDPKRPTIRQRIEKAAIEGGFELVRVYSFLPKDYIFVLEIK